MSEMKIDPTLYLEIVGTLDNVSEFLDNHVDVEDGDYGEPNSAMRLFTEVKGLIETLNRARITNG